MLYRQAWPSASSYWLAEFRGNRIDTQLALAEKIICVREFRKICIGVAAVREQSTVMPLRGGPQSCLLGGNSSAVFCSKASRGGFQGRFVGRQRELRLLCQKQHIAQHLRRGSDGAWTDRRFFGRVFHRCGGSHLFQGRLVITLCPLDPGAHNLRLNIHLIRIAVAVLRECVAQGEQWLHCCPRRLNVP